MNKPLLIESDNTPKSFRKLFKDNIIHFHFTNSKYNNLDKYISEDILGKLKKKNFDIIYIKDSLSLNYLELYGLVVAHHIRLSEELKNTRYIPIIILSDIDGYTLNKLSPLARILFTKNIFLSSNSKMTIETFNQKKFKQNYELKFLNQLEIQAPEKSTNHNIANEWAIDRWAKFLKVDSDGIRKNREKVASMLYFKYLLAKNPINSNSEDEKKYIPKCSGKILLIDDEWDKGWGDIFDKYFSVNSEIEFIIYNNEHKHINLKSIDIVILDLRITQEDHNKDTPIEELTGIKFAKKIKKENPAIQIIMFTATGNSLILEELYKHHILGYIKKGHPKDKSIKIEESLEKLTTLVDTGLEKQYLKEVWEIQQTINPFSSDIKIEIDSIFEILNSDMENRFIYAMFAIFKCIEIINDNFIEEDFEEVNNKKYKYAYWKDSNKRIMTLNWNKLEETKDKGFNISTKIKIRNIMSKFLLNNEKIIKQINQIVCSRNYAIHPEEKKNCKSVVKKIKSDNIIEWFKMLQTILQKIKK